MDESRIKVIDKLYDELVKALESKDLERLRKVLVDIDANATGKSYRGVIVDYDKVLRDAKAVGYVIDSDEVSIYIYCDTLNIIIEMKFGNNGIKQEIDIERTVVAYGQIETYTSED